MGLYDKLGENDNIDSGEIEEVVGYTPVEAGVETSEEKSDAQRVMDGDITLGDGDGVEIFVSPHSVHQPKKVEEEVAEEEVEASEEEKEEVKPQEKEVEAKPAEKVEKKPAAAPDKVQKRFNKITREKYEAQRKAEALEKRLAEAEKRLREVEFEKTKTDLASTKPLADNFEEESEYHEALGRWAAKMEIHENKATVPPVEPAKEEPVDPVQRIIDMGKETYPDFEDLVLREDLKITPLMIEAAADSDYASDIFYHLGQHPEYAASIAQMRSPAKVAREIGRIEQAFISAEVEEVVTHDPSMDSEGIEKSTPKPKKTVSPAPAPVKPLGGGGKTTPSLEDADIASYFELRGYDRSGMKKRQT